jgi:hypothetical protein
MTTLSPALPGVRVRPATSVQQSRSITTRLRPDPRALWFFAPFVLYLVLGAILAFHYRSFHGDAQARTANAYYVLFSRDPHLAAIGFVWNPLPSLACIPLLLFSPLWPALAHQIFAGVIMDAIFMAGAVVQVRGIFADAKLARPVAVILTVLFALHPMIVYYGSNGMSEGLFLFTLLAATRQLIRFIQDGDLASLVKSAVWLGVAYYARNEAVAAVAFGCLVVVAVSFFREGSEIRARIRTCLTEVCIFAAPSVFAFVSWAVASWLIVGHPFEQFSSQYGTSSQLQVMQEQGFKLTGNGGFAIKMAFLMAPLALVTLVIAALRGFLHRDGRWAAPAAILGGVLAFAVVAFAKGQTAGWFRYFISGAPLCVVLAGQCLMPMGPMREMALPRRRRFLAVAGAVLAAVAFAGPSLVTSTAAMADPTVGREEYTHLSYIFKPALGASNSASDERYRAATSDKITQYLDDLNVPNGRILVDTFTPCVPFIILASRHPKHFVITNDRDFKPTLADPATFKVQYILAPLPSYTGSLDAINRAYPTLYDTGADIATQVKEFKDPGCPPFRLFEVKPA